MKLTFLLPLSLSFLWNNFVGAVLVNSTFDDTSDAIVYEPAKNSWFPSSNITQECPQCPNPLEHTYHYGSHFVGKDSDDNPAETAVTNQGDPDAGHGEHDDDDDDGGNDGDGGKGKGKGKGGDGKRRSLLRRADTDDPNFVDTPVNATLTFNGTGVYVYCIVPAEANKNASNPLISNMTFTLDGDLVGHFTHNTSNGDSAEPQFNFSQLVFGRSDLSNEQHTLIISPQLGSMIMLDAINVTTDTNTISSQNAPSNSSSNPSSTDPKKTTDKKGVATFAIAIGSTTGVLAVLAFSVALSIYLRRRRSARREKLREAQEESLRPEMRGPQPFIPRYFPGTLVSQSSVVPSTSTNTSLSRRSSRSSLGPSHGLNYPLAPEIPAYSPPPTILTEIPRPVPISVALRPPVVRVPDADTEDIVPPSYQEVGQTTLLSPSAFEPQPAPSFSELSPTRQPLMLSSDSTHSEGDSEPIPASHMSDIPLILEEDASVVLGGGASSILPRRTRTSIHDSDSEDGPPKNAPRPL